MLEFMRARAGPQLERHGSAIVPKSRERVNFKTFQLNFAAF